MSLSCLNSVSISLPVKSTDSFSSSVESVHSFSSLANSEHSSLSVSVGMRSDDRLGLLVALEKVKSWITVEPSANVTCRGSGGLEDSVLGFDWPDDFVLDSIKLEDMILGVNGTVISLGYWLVDAEGSQVSGESVGVSSEH